MGRWTTEEASRNINELELLVAYFVLQSFTEEAYHILVSLQMDNSTMVC